MISLLSIYPCDQYRFLARLLLINASLSLSPFPSHSATCLLKASISLVEHLLSCLLELASPVHVADVLRDIRLAVAGGVLGRALLGSSVLVDDHALGAGGVFLGRRSVALIARGAFSSSRVCLTNRKNKVNIAIAFNVVR